ncbi:hypothetical protein [Dinghuibacter silviterrae]|uniref:Uncharacterized protein n=1 Tax=Dinghuibacter silviterrae TaxID=1539049 RepID=A0A4R8DVQ5_9BACT|nr:hypothetical protein [Dinghuibacter silviterrae]TDX02126.1 hypothetical protein EDB95_3176 [Dinghuibacter silviterrae]
MITIATVFGAFCLLSAGFQYAFFTLRLQPSAIEIVPEEKKSFN